MRCGACGSELSPGARFCGACGVAVLSVPAPPALASPPESAAAFLDREEDAATLTFSGLVASRWHVVLPNGVTALIEGPLLIGRRPDPAAGPRGARLLTVDDPNRTVSRSHLVLAPSLGGVLATDVSGHNGVLVVADDGSERRLHQESIELTAPCRIALGAVSVWLRSV